jgi:hypothetical protein
MRIHMHGTCSLNSLVKSFHNGWSYRLSVERPKQQLTQAMDLLLQDGK